jgi:hypothetical protein
MEGEQKMFRGQAHRVAGVIMLLLVVTLVVAIFTAETPSTDVDDFPADFQSVVDDEVRYLVGQAMQTLTGIFVALLGGALYVVFRQRDRLLALAGLTGFLLMAGLFVSSTVAYVAVHALANHLEAGETLADEANVLELGRAFTELGDGLFFFGITFFAIGLLGFGMMIGIAPVRPVRPEPDVEEPAIEPPKWLGWLALLAGACYLAGWLFVVAEPFFVFVIVAFFLTLLWYLSFGIWLLRRPQPGRAA